MHDVRLLSVKHFTFRLIYTARGWAYMPIVSSDGLCRFLPRDASAERGDATVSRPSVCPSVRDV